MKKLTFALLVMLVSSTSIAAPVTLKIATAENAELLELSGPRHPYREGKLGVIAEGAYADLILVDGNPLEDLDLIADPEGKFLLIMKDGKIYKNEL